MARVVVGSMLLHQRENHITILPIRQQEKQGSREVFQNQPNRSFCPCQYPMLTTEDNSRLFGSPVPGGIYPQISQITQIWVLKISEIIVICGRNFALSRSKR